MSNFYLNIKEYLKDISEPKNTNVITLENNLTGNIYRLNNITPLSGNLILDLKDCEDNGWAQVYWTSPDGSWPTVTVINGTGKGIAGADITEITKTIGSLPGAGNFNVHFTYINGQLIMFSVDASGASSGGGTTTDTEAPSAITNLAAGTVTETTIPLTWSAATDNVGVTAYEIYVDGVLQAVTAGTTHTLIGLTASTQYSIYVRAKDAAGNGTNSNTITPTTATATSNYLLDQSFAANALLMWSPFLKGKSSNTRAFELQVTVSGALQDIGWDGNDDLDEQLIKDTCGIRHGVVHQLYDLTGNGYDITNPETGSNQPLIYDNPTATDQAGTVVKKGGKVAIQTNATINNFPIAQAIPALDYGNDFTIVTLSASDTANARRTVLKLFNGGSPRLSILHDTTTTAPYECVEVSNGTTVNRAQYSTGPIAVGDYILTTAVVDGTTGEITVTDNNGNGTSMTMPGSYGTVTQLDVFESLVGQAGLVLILTGKLTTQEITDLRTFISNEVTLS